MINKIIDDMDSIAVKAMAILDELRMYGMCEESDFVALQNIRNKTIGAKKLACYLYNNCRNVKILDEVGQDG